MLAPPVQAKYDMLNNRNPATTAAQSRPSARQPARRESSTQAGSASNRTGERKNSPR